MQLLDTQVTPGDQGALRVRFVGEGGDAVEVQIADGNGCRSDDDAITRAKAMLVQIARFSDDNDAHYPEDRHDHRKQTYRIEYCEGEHVRRTPEVELTDDEAARAEVERSALDLIRSNDVPSNAHGWAVRAVDAHDRVIASITYEEARRLRQDGDAEALPAAPI